MSRSDRGARPRKRSRAAGEGWPGGQKSTPNHPSVTFGDSFPQGKPFVSVGANIVRPQESHVTAKLPGRIWNPPLRQPKIWPRRGQTVGRRKSVKKNAALLHFLAFSSNDHPFGVPRGERLAAHNERRQFAAQTRSCGYSPRWGEHCSLPGFAALNRGPLLATPQSPGPCPAPRK